MPSSIDIKNSYKIFLYRDCFQNFISNCLLNKLKIIYTGLKNASKINPFDSLWSFVLKKNLRNIEIYNNEIKFYSLEDYQNHYSIFYSLWLLGLAKNANTCNLFVNYDSLENLNYQRYITKLIQNNLSLNINFENFKISKRDSAKFPALNIDKEINKLIKNNINMSKINIIKKNNDII